MAIEMTNKYVTKYGEEGGLLYGFPEVVFLFLILFFFLIPSYFSVFARIKRSSRQVAFVRQSKFDTEYHQYCNKS